MIEALLPPQARYAEAFDDDGVDGLFDVERAVIADAVPKRQQEFATARRCARSAMAQLGVAAVPLLPGEQGAPGWPDGLVGSMTHCAGYRAAVVARAAELVSIGIDAEPDAALPAGTLDVIALPAERTVLAALPTAGPAWDRILFSAKESVYKAWFPLARRFLDFTQATVDLAPDGRFTARVLAPGPVVAGRPLQRMTGRWLAIGGLVLTCVVVPDDEGPGLG